MTHRKQIELQDEAGGGATMAAGSVLAVEFKQSLPPILAGHNGQPVPTGPKDAVVHRTGIALVKRDATRPVVRGDDAGLHGDHTIQNGFRHSR